MKVLGLCSGRVNGNTEMMMKEAFMAIEEKIEGVECQLVRIQETKINSCIGCEACMINHLKGNWEFRCVHGVESDHVHFIEQMMREADAIIVSSPAYNLLPTGQLIKLLNKMHATGDYRAVYLKEENFKVAGAFSIGGTDWTNFTLNTCKMIAMEMCGAYSTMADAVHFDFYNGIGNVLIDDVVMPRMRQFGENIADALIARANGQKYEYKGDQGICPDCHGTLLEIREDGVYCPECLTKANVSLVDGNLIAEFTEEARGRNRWSDWGRDHHDNNIRKGHVWGAENRDRIQERSKKYKEYGHVVELPEIK